jgi:ribosomal protein S18 acetylase RimI-like enzyme
VSPVSIRTARRADFDALVRLYTESAQYHQRIDPALYRIPEATAVTAWLEAALSSTDVAILVAEAMDDVIGFAVVRLAPPAPAASMLEPRRGAELDVAVSAAFRRQGVGRALLDAACAWAARHTCRLVMLNCHVANQAAVRLYESGGFRTLGLLMRRNLDGA